MLILAAAIALGAVALDQITKAFVSSHYAVGDARALFPGLRLYYTKNDGAAFSILSGHRWLFLWFSMLAMGLIVYLLIRYSRRHPLLTVSLAMVLGGGLGNLIDRVLYGSVVDFLDFTFMRFAVFNVADIFVTCGAVALGVYLLFVEPRVEKRLRAAEEAENPSDEAGNVSDEQKGPTDGINEDSDNHDGTPVGVKNASEDRDGTTDGINEDSDYRDGPPVGPKR